MFAGFHFALDSTLPQKVKQHYSSLIKENGGIVELSVNKRTTHFISPLAQVNSFRAETADQHGACVVIPNWVDECIEQGKLVSVWEFQFIGGKSALEYGKNKVSVVKESINWALTVLNDVIALIDPNVLEKYLEGEKEQNARGLETPKPITSSLSPIQSVSSSSSHSRSSSPTRSIRSYGSQTSSRLQKALDSPFRSSFSSSLKKPFSLSSASVSTRQKTGYSSPATSVSSSTFSSSLLASKLRETIPTHLQTQNSLTPTHSSNSNLEQSLFEAFEELQTLSPLTTPHKILIPSLDNLKSPLKTESTHTKSPPSQIQTPPLNPSKFEAITLTEKTPILPLSFLQTPQPHSTPIITPILPQNTSLTTPITPITLKDLTTTTLQNPNLLLPPSINNVNNINSINSANNINNHNEGFSNEFSAASRENPISASLSGLKREKVLSEVELEFKRKKEEDEERRKKQILERKALAEKGREEMKDKTSEWKEQERKRKEEREEQERKRKEESRQARIAETEARKLIEDERKQKILEERKARAEKLEELKQKPPIEVSSSNYAFFTTWMQTESQEERKRREEEDLQKLLASEQAKNKRLQEIEEKKIEKIKQKQYEKEAKARSREEAMMAQKNEKLAEKLKRREEFLKQKQLEEEKETKRKETARKEYAERMQRKAEREAKQSIAPTKQEVKIDADLRKVFVGGIDLDDFADEKALKKKGITPQKANALRDERINNLLKIFNRFGVVEKRRVFTKNKKTSIFITYKDPKVAVNVVSILKDSEKRKEQVKPFTPKIGKPSPNDIPTQTHPLALPRHTFYVRLVRNRENLDKTNLDSDTQKEDEGTEDINESNQDNESEEEASVSGSLENESSESEPDLGLKGEKEEVEGEEEEEEKQGKQVSKEFPPSILVKGKKLDDFVDVLRISGGRVWSNEAHSLKVAPKKEVRIVEDNKRTKNKKGKEREETETIPSDNLFFTLFPQQAPNSFLDESEDISRYQVHAPSHLLQTFYQTENNGNDHHNSSTNNNNNNYDDNDQETATAKKKQAKKEKEARIDPIIQSKTVKMISYLLSSWAALLEENITTRSCETEIRDLLDLQQDHLSKGFIQDVKFRIGQLLEKQNALNFAKLQKEFAKKPKYPNICDNMFEQLRETEIKL